MARRISTGLVARVGVLGAIASILYYFPEIPVIGFYKLDFSTMPALLGGFALGPLAGTLIVLIKDLIGLTHSSSMGVGELADFLMSVSLVVTAANWYRRDKTFKGALTGMVLGTLLMAVVGALSNYYLLIPFYIGVNGWSQEMIIGSIAATLPAVDSLFKLVLYATAPFNLLKGFVLCAITILLYKRLSGLLHGGK